MNYVFFFLFTQDATNSINCQDVYKENWFHGKISREEVRISTCHSISSVLILTSTQAEQLLTHSGDFLVRESAKYAGQFILSGRYNDQFKHLLLVDPEGVVRNSH